MAENTVWVIGAGSTYSDGINISPTHMRPPLDSGFFAYARKKYPEEVDPLREYFLENYGWDIVGTQYDSLESAMVALYTDALNPFYKKAERAFRKLIRLYNERLVETSNAIEENRRRNMYRLFHLYLGTLKIPPESLTVLTFNHDIHIEKSLDLYCQRHSDNHLASFAFPDCYCFKPEDVAVPPTPGDTFAVATTRKSKVHILKLHGSYNWFSLYESEEFSTSKMFAKNRKVYVHCGCTQRTQLRYKRGDKVYSTFPVIVPPIMGKSVLMHPNIQGIWKAAEEALGDCQELVFFGYSLPSSDIESVQLMRRAIKATGSQAHKVL